MPITGIFISDNYLKHIFGENHEQFVINFGIKKKIDYPYKVVSQSSNHKYTQYFGTEEDIPYLHEFWSDNLISVTAIVGGNGTGKTTLLEAILKDQSLLQYTKKNTDGQPQSIFIYYSPHYSLDKNEYCQYNRFNLSKYCQIKEDISNRDVSFEVANELHNSFAIERIIRLTENDFLKDLELPIFDSIILEFKGHDEVHNNTPYEFRQLFESISKLLLEERDAMINSLDNNSKEKFDYRISIYKIRLRYNFLISFLEKINQILEYNGNSILVEGEYSNDGVKGQNALEQIKHFLKNATTKNASGSLFEFDKIEPFIDYIINLINDSFEIQKLTTEIKISFSETQNVIKLYQDYLMSFKTNLKYSNSPLLSFHPSRKLSTG
ncbi:MAG: hypothetical protein N4A45_01545 [Flavobacteriales bacterium]|jgi:hypothetical protein|nr:hypothetical protein [Flavobacteriales bacterium]